MFYVAKAYTVYMVFTFCVYKKRHMLDCLGTYAKSVYIWNRKGFTVWAGIYKNKKESLGPQRYHLGGLCS